MYIKPNVWHKVCNLLSLRHQHSLSCCTHAKDCASCEYNLEAQACHYMNGKPCRSPKNECRIVAQAIEHSPDVFRQQKETARQQKARY